MNRRMKLRLKDEEYFMYEVFDVGSTFFGETMRCPKCGAPSWEDDVVAGMRQYCLPLDMSDYDLWYLFARCHECGKRYVYQARIDPDK